MPDESDEIKGDPPQSPGISQEQAQRYEAASAELVSQGNLPNARNLSVGDSSSGSFSPKSPGAVFNWVKSKALTIGDIRTAGASGTGIRESLRAALATERSPILEAERAQADFGAPCCAFVDCPRVLSLSSGKFHCQKCNKWYCASHAGHPSYSMRLDPNTFASDSTSGSWTRVCSGCFEERAGYRSRKGASQSRMDIFRQLRARHAEIIEKELAILERRLEIFEDYKRGMKINGKTVGLKEFEKAVVPWIPDKDAIQCYCCHSQFTPLLRKHHCRFCGNVICGEKDCSTAFPLRTGMSDDHGVMEIRSCKSCFWTLFGRKRLTRELTLTKSEMQQLYSALAAVKVQIEEMLPRFNELLVDMSEAKATEKALEYREDASTVRDTLVLLFVHLETSSKQFLKLSTHGTLRHQDKLCTSIFKATNIFLQKNMFTLQLLPDASELKRRRRAVSEELRQQSTLNKESGIPFALSIRSSASLLNSSFNPFRHSTGGLEDVYYENLPMPAPANLVALLEKLEVLQEQRVRIGEELDALLRRRGDAEEVGMLRGAYEELTAEIDQIQVICARL